VLPFPQSEQIGGRGFCGYFKMNVEQFLKKLKHIHNNFTIHDRKIVFWKNDYSSWGVIPILYAETIRKVHEPYLPEKMAVKKLGLSAADAKKIKRAAEATVPYNKGLRNELLVAVGLNHASKKGTTATKKKVVKKKPAKKKSTKKKVVKKKTKKKLVFRKCERKAIRRG
jgi:hypothetical protein